MDKTCIAYYEKKAEPFTQMEGFTTEHYHGKGFFSWRKTGDTLVLGHCCGDMRWLHSLAVAKAKELHCKGLMTTTARNPAAYLRRCYMLGYNVWLNVAASGYGNNGRWYWAIEGVIT